MANNAHYGVCVDSEGRAVKEFRESNGKIEIVYRWEDHYPSIGFGTSLTIPGVGPIRVDKLETEYDSGGFCVRIFGSVLISFDPMEVFDEEGNLVATIYPQTPAAPEWVPGTLISPTEIPSIIPRSFGQAPLRIVKRNAPGDGS